MTLRLVWPLWASLLIFLPLLGLCLTLAWRSRKRGRPLVRAWLRRGGMVVLLALIALGPAVPAATETVRTNAEVFFVVDRTGSMAAEDYNEGEPRLEGVRHDIMGIVEAMPGARFSIVSFDSRATRQLPLTTDTRAVGTWTETLTQEITAYSAGSAIDRPIETLTEALEGAEERSPENVRVVFLLADGENTEGDDSAGDEEVGSYEELADLVDAGGVLGYGTPDGGRMRVYDGTPETGAGTDAAWIKDTTKPDDPPAISRIDETQLRRVADQLGVDYSHRTAPDDVSGLVSDIDVDTIAEEDNRREVTVYADIYWPIAAVLAVLLAWEAGFQARRFPRLAPRPRPARHT